MSFFDTEDKKEYPLIPEGEHIATLHNVTCDLDKDPVRVSVQYKLENNRRLFQNFNINEKGKTWFTWQLRELGLLSAAKNLLKDPDKAVPVEIAKAIVDAAAPMLNKTLKLNVKHDVWQGKTREKPYVVEGVTMSETAPKGVDLEEKLPF